MADNWLVKSFPGNTEPDLKIKTYDPDKLPYKPRIPESLWNTIRPTLERLHKAGRKRWEMLEVLARDFDFRPSRHQLNVRMAKWGLRVHKVGTEEECTENSLDDVQSHMQTLAEHSFDTTMNHGFANSDLMNGPQDQNFLSSFQDIFGDRLLHILQGSAPLHHSEWFCVLHDVIDFLKHSLWYVKYSHIFVRYLMHTVESRDVAITTDAHLVVILDCLRWPVMSGESFMADWAYDQLEILEASSIGSPPFEYTLLFLHCCIIGSRQATSRDWSRLMNRTVMSCPNPHVLSDYEARFVSVLNPVLHSCADTVAVEHSFMDQETYLNHDRIDALLSWCGINIEFFAPNCNTNAADSTHVNVQFLRDSYSDLSQYLIHKWIEHTHQVAPDPATLNWTAHPLQIDECQQRWSDLVLFRAIARTLAFLSILIVMKARKFLFASMSEIQDPRQAVDMLSGVPYMYRAAIRELEWEHGEASLQPSEHTPPPLGDLDDDTITKIVQCSVDHATGMAYESYTLRQSPASVRHSSALGLLPRKLDRWKGLTTSNDASATLCKSSSSSSSLRSFSRAGIKLKDRIGASSSSGKSSAAISGGGIFSIAEWSQTVFDDGMMVDSEVMLPEIQDSWDELPSDVPGIGLESMDQT